MSIRISKPFSYSVLKQFQLFLLFFSSFSNINTELNVHTNKLNKKKTRLADRKRNRQDPRNFVKSFLVLVILNKDNK
jgi:hypothetical protein